MKKPAKQKDSKLANILMAFVAMDANRIKNAQKSSKGKPVVDSSAKKV